MVEIRHRAVVEEIEHADTGKGLGDDVGENRVPGVEIHGGKAAEDEVELGKGVDYHEDVGGLQVGLVPEDHPG